jgi:hypothetical protein
MSRMSIDTAAQSHAAHRKDASADLVNALNEFSPENREMFVARWMEASLEAESTGDNAAVVRLLQSLRISRHLHERGDFQQSMNDAEHLPWDEPVDVAAHLARLHEAQRA